MWDSYKTTVFMSKTYILSYLNVPDAFNAGGVDVGVVGGGEDRDVVSRHLTAPQVQTLPD